LLTLGTSVPFVRWPTVPKGGDRIRVCLNAGHSRQDVERLAENLVGWANGILEKQKESHEKSKHWYGRVVSSGNVGEEIVASKL
jgi:8-amino-7-oxononanoate synthase